MLSAFDQLIISAAGISALSFVALQILVFRFVPAFEVLKWIMSVYGVSAVLNLGITLFGALKIDALQASGIGGIGLIVLLSFVLYSIMTTVYVFYILGAYESSIRLRIVQELDRHYPQGCSLNTLLESYNAEVILKRRLDRLLSAGDISFDNKMYRIKKVLNFFLLSDSFGRRLKRFISG